MDDERQFFLSCCTNVGTKTFALPLHVGNRAATFALIHLVVVQPRFANTHHPGQLAAAHQVVKCGFLHALVVWVYAHRGPHVGVVQCKLMHLRKVFQRGADAQRTGHLRVLHVLQDLGQTLLQFREIQVAMGIGKHAIRLWSSGFAARR